MNVDYDVIVIGSGPGGEGAAMKCAKAGKSVLIVDAGIEVGGNCTHKGTIPSKALRHTVQHLANIDKKRIKYAELLRSAEKVIRQQVDLRQGFYDRNNVEVKSGWARFTGANSIEIMSDGNVSETFSFDYVILATGSRPYHPEDMDFSSPFVHDSDSILTMKETPRSICIYGAGVIGCEYATIFKRLGIKVDLINTRDKLLSYLDDEISDALAYHMRQNGIMIRHNEYLENIDVHEHGVSLRLQSNKLIHADCALWAVGRTGNSQNMGLEELGIETDSRGNISINDNYQTNQAHIYAVGDVVGFPSLASAAYDQGRFAAIHLIEGKCEYKLVEQIPTGIYTIPEISCIGKTEKELTDEKIPYEVGHSLFKNLARAQITGEMTGMLKLLFHRETLEILGIHCFGYQASEIIHIGQAILAQEPPANSLEYFINTTFNYPTMAEAYRVAALNGINRV
ncbi:MAG: Si-specific NAD(P)(+) transhydrogenase [Lentisphaeria bacterium]|nr:Si-specific NAD(P)(+) transhydrogenase [Lentisphaeria bacterium]NQZ69519.1 Si-specific NAD(P)(+) transhydrogenase [Lentisphaeria bacterium]